MGQYKKENMAKLNKHRDLSKPFWAAITEVAGIIHYGKITGSNLVMSKYVIKVYVHKQSMINFIEENNGTFIEFEL